MNIYHLSLVEQILKNTAEGFAAWSYTEMAINFDQRQKLKEYLKEIHQLYFGFFLRAGFLRTEVKYCTNEYTEILDLGTNSENIALNKTIENLKNSVLPPSRHFFSIVPIHTRISEPDSFILLTGVAGKEMGSNLATIVGKELTVNKDLLDEVPLGLSYLKNVLQAYNPKKYDSLREYIKTINVPYSKIQEDCQTCFSDSFYKLYLKLNIASAISDILFSYLPLKEIAINHFSDYRRMHDTFKRYGISPKHIPRLNYQGPVIV